jgi:hypothetical protein
VTRDASNAKPGRWQWLARGRLSQKMLEGTDGRSERRQLAALSSRGSAGLDHHTHHLARFVEQWAAELVIAKPCIENQRVLEHRSVATEQRPPTRD